VIGELEKLHVRDRYSGNKQIHTASGSGMDIRHIGNSVTHTPTHDLHLNDIIHVPQASRSLLSTSHLTKDNNVFVEYWPDSFFLRIGTRGKSCLKVDAWEASTPYQNYPLYPLVGKLMVS
jgi:hypothetical protein